MGRSELVQTILFTTTGPTFGMALDLNRSLEEARTLVGGWCEIVAVPGSKERLAFIVDEEGRVRSKPENWRATGLMRALAGHSTLRLVGAALLVRDMGGEFRSAPAWARAALL